MFDCKDNHFILKTNLFTKKVKQLQPLSPHINTWTSFFNEKIIFIIIGIANDDAIPIIMTQTPYYLE